MARAVEDSRSSWIQARYNFFNSPEGNFLILICILGVLLVYVLSVVKIRGQYDARLAQFAEQVCTPGWRIRHSGFPPASILIGTHGRMKFRYAVYGKGVLSKAHLFLETLAHSSGKISVLNQESMKNHASLPQHVPGFRALYSSSAPVPFYVCSVDTRPWGFGSDPGVDLLVSRVSYFDPALFEQNLEFLEQVSRTQRFEDVLP